MGEIDTKSIESVQSALCFFGEKNDLIKTQPNNYDEREKEKELQGILKDLANCKVQLEAKESAHKQALFDLAHYRKIVEELNTLLEISDFERDIYINDCKEAKMHLEQLESKLKQVSDQLSETTSIRDQLSDVTVELNSTQEELLSAETQLAEAREVNLVAMTQAQLTETALNMEKMKTDELVRHLSVLNETVMHLKISAFEADKEKYQVLSKKELELESARESVIESQEQLNLMRNELKIVEELETLLLEKCLLVDFLQAEHQQANELLCLAKDNVCNAIKIKNMLEKDLQVKERENFDQANYIKSLEFQLEKAKKESNRLHCEVEELTGELEKIKIEAEEISERESEAQVEIAMLKSELHKGRSRIAAAEAAEERAKGEKAETYLALHQLALEAEEAKKENLILKEEAIKVVKENTGIEDDTRVTISLEEYEDLVKKAEDSVIKNDNEVENLKKELEAATVRMGELRTRAEQAASRAEAAELAKAAIEEQISRWRRQKEKRKAAFAELREESIARESYSLKYDETPKPYQPLSKVLNMKF